MNNNSVERNDSLQRKAVSISWHNIQVFGKKPKMFYECTKRAEPSEEIIRKVSGEVKAGQLLAIMGASGAGKTTLLNVLTARNLSDLIVKGVVKLNRRVADVRTITSVSAYVQQTDIFIPTMTVREQLTFSAFLRMNRKFTKEERIERVNQILTDFGLLKCADTEIGDPTSFKGISGGESKRLALASEMFADPSIMFCDEPTSGLDSFMAENVVQILKRMSIEGRTIICTIHQPSSQVFRLFEQLLLMADGRVAYMGSIDNAFTFFSSLGFVCPLNYNPCDFYIEKIAPVPGKEAESKEKIRNFCDQYMFSDFGQHMKSLIRDEREDSFKEKSKKCTTFDSKYKVSCYRQFTNVYWRSFLTSYREPIISRIRLIQALIIAITLGIAYWQQKINQSGIRNINGALFLLITNMTFQNSLAVVNTFCAELPLYYREHHNGMYRVDVYFLSKMFAELPVFTAIPIIFVSTYYFMVGFNDEFDRFLITNLIGVLITQCAVSFGYLMSCVSSSATMAASLGPPLLIPLVLFGGFFIGNDTIPGPLVWIKYISWYYYGFEALIINQWKGLKISCDTPTGTPPTVSSNSSNPSNHCRFNTGEEVIKELDFSENNLIRDIYMLIVLVIVIRILAFIALYLKSRKR